MKPRTMNKAILAFLIILTSFIYGLPHIILSQKLGPNYNPLIISNISPISREETYGYAPFVNYILKGHFFLREALVYEYKDYPSPYLGETFPSQILASLAKISGSMQKAFVIGDFIFPPIIFVLIYILFATFIKNRSYVLAASFLVVISRDFIAIIPYPKAIIDYFNLAQNNNFFLYLARAPHPQITLIILICSFLAITKLINNPNSKARIVMLGLTSGLLFYCYIYAWTYFFAFFCLALTFYITRKNYRVTKSLALAFVIALMLGSYYFLTVFQFSHLAISEDLTRKMSQEISPLSLSILRYLAITVAFFLFVKKKDQKFYALLLFLIVGLIIPTAFEFILGRDLETTHYVRRILMPFATIAFLVSTYNLISRNKYLVYSLSLIIFITALVIGIKTQVTASYAVASAHVMDADLRRVFYWLNSNTKKDEVIGSLNVLLGDYLPSYTSNRVYFPHTNRSITPVSEGVERYAILANILGVPIKLQEKSLETNAAYMFHFAAYTKGIGLDLKSPRIKQAQTQLDDLARNDLWRGNLNKYKLDYVIVTPEEANIIKPKSEFLKPIASIGGYIIFKFVNP